MRATPAPAPAPAPLVEVFLESATPFPSPLRTTFWFVAAPPPRAPAPTRGDFAFVVAVAAVAVVATTLSDGVFFALGVLLLPGLRAAELPGLVGGAPVVEVFLESATPFPSPLRTTFWFVAAPPPRAPAPTRGDFAFVVAVAAVAVVATTLGELSGDFAFCAGAGGLTAGESRSDFCRSSCTCVGSCTFPPPPPPFPTRGCVRGRACGHAENDASAMPNTKRRVTSEQEGTDGTGTTGRGGGDPAAMCKDGSPSAGRTVGFTRPRTSR